MADIDRADWNALVGEDHSPFLEWEWLSALEESGCAAPATGWAPHHVVVRHGGELIAAAPAYVKSHSQGEFVFDHGWADAAERAGIRYYPKLLVGVPFTPATGRRVLTHPSADREPVLRAVGRAIGEICVANDISSAHVNFCREDEVRALGREGFLHRQGVQYHWLNRGYDSFEDYLAALKSKRRNQIRRERRDLTAAGVEIEILEGDAIADELFEPMFRIYLSTIQKLYWGQQYLNRELFELLKGPWRRNLVFVLARRAGEIVAGAIDVQKAGVLYGRYWGCFREIRNLHFEVCYYRGIEHCIERGLQRFEPGAGGDFKYLRGFEGVATHSMHFVAHEGFARAVDDYLRRERAHIDEAIAEMRERGPVKIAR
jgi:predicted N-acyltransferase